MPHASGRYGDSRRPRGGRSTHKSSAPSGENANPSTCLRPEPIPKALAGVRPSTKGVARRRRARLRIVLPKSGVLSWVGSSASPQRCTVSKLAPSVESIGSRTTLRRRAIRSSTPSSSAPKTQLDTSASRRHRGERACDRARKRSPEAPRSSMVSERTMTVRLASLNFPMMASAPPDHDRERESARLTVALAERAPKVAGIALRRETPIDPGQQRAFALSAVSASTDKSRSPYAASQT